MSDPEPKVFDPTEVPPFTDRIAARLHIAAKSGKKPEDTIKVKMSDLYGILLEVHNAHQRMALMLGLPLDEEEDNEGN